MYDLDLKVAAVKVYSEMKCLRAASDLAFSCVGVIAYLPPARSTRPHELRPSFDVRCTQCVESVCNLERSITPENKLMEGKPGHCSAVDLALKPFVIAHHPWRRDCHMRDAQLAGSAAHIVNRPLQLVCTIPHCKKIGNNRGTDTGCLGRH